MALAPGTRLGPYSITKVIGTGGMGEVYQATDTRLDRTVAVKVLPHYVSSDPGLKQRFDREAKAISSLNHPHICTLHDVGSQDGIDFLVLEYLEGETLADRLTKGPLSIQQVLSIATQVADALDKAHRQGLVHRDLKPGNIMLTKGGAKLLDFGLAKLRPVATVGAGTPSAALTVSSPLTGVGSIVGTFQYMAPEQLEGKEADARTDIFAFGAVLYEMLMGKKAFEGKSHASLIAAILNHQPLPPSAMQPLSPPAVDHVVATCLAKDPDERWQNAGDLVRELRWISETREPGAGAHTPAPDVMHQRRRVWAVAGLVGAVVGSAVTAFVVPSVDRSKPAPAVTRLEVGVAPADQLRASPSDHITGLGRPSRTAIVLSPDGRSLVFSAVRDGHQQLYVRSLSDVEATPIRGTEGAHSPFFSPDGNWLGFWAGGALRKLAFGEGGPPVKVCDTPPIFGASWGRDQKIVFAGRTGGLWQVSVAGGTAQALTTLDDKQGEASHRLPHVLPGNAAILFTVTHSQIPAWDKTKIAVQSIATGERRVLIEGGEDARYIPTGHLVYVREGTLMAVPFDLDRLAVTGAPVALIADVMQAINFVDLFSNAGAGQFSVSTSGTLVYLPGGVSPEPDRSLLWVSRNGAEQPLPWPSRSYTAARLSPDGKRVAFSTSAPTASVWIDDTLRGSPTRVMPERQALNPIWTPDGKRIAFLVVERTPAEIVWAPVDAIGTVERLVTTENYGYPQSWTADGSTLAFVESHPETGNDIWVLPLHGDRQPRAVLRTRFAEAQAEFSPDGRWLAYSSNESGRDEVYVQPYPGPGIRQAVSVEGGNTPAWARDGRELFYTTLPKQDGRIRMMAVPVRTGGSFTAGTPQTLFEGRYLPTRLTRSYDVGPDGRFLMVREVERPPLKPTHMILVQNWFEELKARVPPK